MRRWIMGCIFLVKGLYGTPFALEEIKPVFRDEEVEALWRLLDNPLDPSIDDYRKFEYYLEYGRRAYLDPMFEHAIATGWFTPDTLDRIATFSSRFHPYMKFTGPNGDVPSFEKRVLGGVSEENKSRCIVLYATFNQDPFDHNTKYISRMLDRAKELEEIGFKGHLLIRSGGYPLIKKGGFFLAHVPYAFKVLSLIEASQLGYDEVLWMDCSLHPTNDLSEVFSEIREKGTLLIGNAINLDCEFGFRILPVPSIHACNLQVEDLALIPSLIATAIGISFKSPKSHDLIREWYRLTSLVQPAVTLYPEQFLLSVAAWRTGNVLSGQYYNFFDSRRLVPDKPSWSEKPFWFDK